MYLETCAENRMTSYVYYIDFYFLKFLISYACIERYYFCKINRKIHQTNACLKGLVFDAFQCCKLKNKTFEIENKLWAHRAQEIGKG